MQAKGLRRAVFGAAGAAAVLLSGVMQAAGVPGQGTWETTLLGRDIGGHAVAASSADAVFLYDTTLNVTWLRDANVNGRMTWDTANTWANGLVVGAWSDWRLPTLSPVDGHAFQTDFANNGSTDRGYAKTGTGWAMASEMGHLFYVTLGNKGQCTPNDASPGSCVPQPGSGLTNTGTFQNMQSGTFRPAEEEQIRLGAHTTTTGPVWTAG